MTIKEIQNLFQEIGNNLLNYDVEHHFSEEIVADILKIETALFRARMKIERTYNHK